MIVGERDGEACRYECVGFHDRNCRQHVRKVCTCEWNSNNDAALAGIPQKAAHCLGFESSTSTRVVSVIWGLPLTGR